MNGNKKKITLESLYNLLFTVGVMLIMMGVGLLEGTDMELTEGLKPIVLGVVLLGVGLLFYYMKIKEPTQSLHETPPINLEEPTPPINLEEEEGG